MGVKGSHRPLGRKGDLRYSSKVRSFGGGGFIPIRRGFLALPKVDVTLEGQWKKGLVTLTRLAERYEAIIDRAVREEAQFFNRLLVQGLMKQAPAGTALMPLSPVTLAIRRKKGISSDKILIATGEMMKSIKAHKMGSGYYFTGIRSGVTNRDGHSLAIIAQEHEEGRTKSKFGKNHIPQRSFFEPIWQKYGSNKAEVKKRFEQRVNNAMIKDLNFDFFGPGMFGAGIAVKSRGGKQRSNRSTNARGTP